MLNLCNNNLKMCRCVEICNVDLYHLQFMLLSCCFTEVVIPFLSASMLFAWFLSLSKLHCVCQGEFVGTEILTCFACWYFKYVSRNIICRVALQVLLRSMYEKVFLPWCTSASLLLAWYSAQLLMLSAVAAVNYLKWIFQEWYVTSTLLILCRLLVVVI